MFANLEKEQSKRGLSDQDMAHLLAMTPNAYAKRKRDGKFKCSQIVKLLSLFNCDFDYLFEEKEISEAE